MNGPPVNFPSVWQWRIPISHLSNFGWKPQVPTHPPMKKWFVVFVAALWSTVGLADEIKIRGAAWDDLSQALGIIPFYIEIQSATPAKKLGLKLEIYQEGKLVKTLQNTFVTGQHAKPINLKSALFFRPSENAADYETVWTTLTGGSTGTGHGIVSKSILDFSGFGFSTKSTARIIGTEKRTLITIILCHKGTAALADTVEATIAANEGATVAGLYLEHE